MREPPLDFPAYKSTALRHPKQPLIAATPAPKRTIGRRRRILQRS